MKNKTFKVAGKKKTKYNIKHSTKTWWLNLEVCLRKLKGKYIVAKSVSFLSTRCSNGCVTSGLPLQ